jgi:hypothetical protein
LPYSIDSVRPDGSAGGLVSHRGAPVDGFPDRDAQAILADALDGGMSVYLQKDNPIDAAKRVSV